jgi:hypothetical protein
MNQESFNLDIIELYAMSVRDDDGIPAIELDLTTSEYNLLLFTSEEAVRRYCMLQKPSQIEKIYKLPRKETDDGKIHQVGLIRLARICKLRYKQITGIVFDHPGHTKTIVKYATIDSVINSNITIAPKNKNIIDFLLQAEKEDSK